MNTPPLILIPDYSFADRAELDNDPTGTYHKRCDIECQTVRGELGDKKVMGERCIGCGYTVWVDPINGGIDDRRDKETIWLATKELEVTLNQLGITIKEAKP